jgi:hypothetical protein
MAYAPGFDIDVFLSYAHKNNENGWVEQFRAFLARRVPEFLPHAADVKVWRDDRLTGFDELWPTLQSNIEGSAIFLSICSPVYVTSKNCAQEVEYFLERSRNAVRLERQSRLARIAIIPYTTEPDALPLFQRDDTVFYTFFDERPDGTIDQYQPGSTTFAREADRVAQHLASQLRRLRDAAERSAARQPSGPRQAIFIANSSRDRAEDRLTVVNEFREHDVLTVPDGTYGREELTTLTSDLLARAVCSVHLLGDNPGPSVDEGDPPISHLQYRLARAHRPERFTQVVWAPTTMKPAAGRQQELVESIRAYKDDVWDRATELLSGTLDELLRGLRGVLQRQPEVARLEGGGPLYLLCTKADLEQDDGALRQLRDSLHRAGVLPELPAFDPEEGVDLAELERTLIAQSRGTLIYYGRGTDTWVKLKRLTLTKVLGELKAQGEYVRALYLGGPATTPKQAQYVGLGPTLADASGMAPILVLGNASGFEPEHLKPLLERIAASRS